jgi:KAP family P-loop domain
MRIHVERLLAEFVDREVEMARYREMLDDRGVCVFAVWGGGGVGKSSLQAKMIHEVATRKIIKSEVIWTETRNHDFLAILRKIRDDLGAEHFSGFTALVNSFTDPQHHLRVTLEGNANISVAAGATIEDGANIGRIAGVIIEDVMLTDPHAGMQDSAGERRARLTDAFAADMAAAFKDREAVVFFDAVEKMTEDTEDWVWGELLPAACDGQLGEVKFVLSGRRKPAVDRLWRGVIEVAELQPLPREHVLLYLEKRGVAEADREVLAKTLLMITKGNMLALANYVDGYLKLPENERREPADN